MTDLWIKLSFLQEELKKMVRCRGITLVCTHLINGIWQLGNIIIVMCLLYIVTFMLVLPHLCKNLPYCKLYQGRHTDFKNALLTNHLRVEEARSFMKTLNSNETKRIYEKHKKHCCPRYAIGVVTISRTPRRRSSTERPLYLTQTMMKLHEILIKEKATSDVALFICDVDRFPDYHVEATNLSQYFPMTSKFRDQVRLRNALTMSRNQYEQEKVDYIFCLKQALNYNPKYVLLLQDDAYPLHNFYSVMDHVVKTKLEYKIVGGENVTNKVEWCWLKLNMPEDLMFYERNWYFAMEWVSLSVFLSGMLSLVYYLCNFQSLLDTRYLRTKPYICKAYLIFFLSFFFVFLSLVVIGRPYVESMRGISKYFYTLGPGTSCCLPAVLYPAKQVPYIVGYLNHVRCDNFQKLDFALDDYQNEMELQQYLISPNLFKHIGMYSGLRRSYNLRGPQFYLT